MPIENVKTKIGPLEAIEATVKGLEYRGHKPTAIYMSKEEYRKVAEIIKSGLSPEHFGLMPFELDEYESDMVLMGLKVYPLYEIQIAYK